MSRVERNAHIYEENAAYEEYEELEEQVTVSPHEEYLEPEAQKEQLESVAQNEPAAQEHVERRAQVQGEKHIKHEKKAVKQKKKPAVFGWCMKLFGIVTVTLTVIACLSLAIPNVLGLDSYIVVSGSMVPTVPVGSILYSRDVDPAQVEVGEIIVFVDPIRSNDPITHRVVENDTANQTMITKGDANEGNDVDPVQYENVLGISVLHLPFLGFLASPFATKMGKVAAAAFMLGGWLLAEIGNRLIKMKRASEDGSH